MKRLPIIRHVRWFFMNRGLQRHLDAWSIVSGMRIAQQSDLDYLDAVWNGTEP